MSLTPVCLDIDGSIASSEELRALFRATASLRFMEQELRVQASPDAINAVREEVLKLRKKNPNPWLTLIGSGDLHHLTKVLLETLPEANNPTTLVLIDNHPDWFRSPKRHCGTWVSEILANQAIERVILVGQDSAGDLRGIDFFSAPLKELSEGRVELFPLSKSSVLVPFIRMKEDAAVVRKTNWYGTELQFCTIRPQGTDQFFEALAERLRGSSVYLSIDLDCLSESEIFTEWDQGGLSAKELIDGVAALRSSCNLIGADIVGGAPLTPLSSWKKRILAGRFRAKASTSSQSHASRIIGELVSILAPIEQETISCQS